MVFGFCGLGYRQPGCLSLNEMQTARESFGLGIERDPHWIPEMLRDVRSHW